MNFTEFCEEWKPFPKDKVNRKIEKKEKRHKDEWDGKANTQAHAMKTVKNFVTKNTDSHKANQAWSGKDREKWNKQKDKIADETSKKRQKWLKSEDKLEAAKKKDKKKLEKKATKKYDKYLSGRDKKASNTAIVNHVNNSHRSDMDKQAEHNKKDKESRATAKRMMNRAGLEAAYKKPTSKTESLNFTDWMDSLCDPLYEADGEMQCPPGYKFNKKTMRCEPKSKKDDVTGGTNNKDRHPDNGPGFNVIGSHGMNGAPYAYEEPGDGGE